MRLKLNIVMCGCGQIRRLFTRTGSFFPVDSSYQIQSRRRIQTITEVREYLKSVVGAKSTYSESGPGNFQTSTEVVSDQKTLQPRLMQDSFQSVLIPLSDASFREKYINSHQRIRFGQLLENLDTFAVLIAYQHNEPLLSKLGILLEDCDLLAGIVAYKHCDPRVLNTGISPLSIVTAMVDEVRIHDHDIDPTQDILMDGHVTWSGRSSLEIGMLLTQNGRPALDAQFVMVARDAKTSKAAVVHPLEPSTDEEKTVFENGNLNKARRMEEVNASLLETPPTLEEKDLVHNLFRSTLDSRSKSFSSRYLPEGNVWMNSTKLKNAIICFPQKRNIHNNIFGGFLMRKGYELAWANACVYSRSTPNCVAMDDIIFHCPVPIGSLLLMSSQISYVEGDYFCCRVHAEVMDPRTTHCRTSNEFHFMFTCDAPTPPIMPQTYGESMLYLDGRRRLKSRLES